MNGLKCLNQAQKNDKSAQFCARSYGAINIRSLIHPMSLVQNSRSIFDNFAGYLLTRMDGYPHASSFRRTVYLLEGVLIGLFFYLWLEYTQTEELFKTYYPIFVAFSIIFWHYLVTEFGGRFIYKRRKLLKVTIGKFWMISFAGVFFGYIMIYFNGQCPGIAKYYPDISSFYSSHSSPTLVRLAVFYKIVLIPWAISTFLLTQGELKKQIANELASIKQINDLLDHEKSEIAPQKTSINDTSNPLKDEGENRARCFEVQLKEGSRHIPFTDIYYIAIEDHYCKLVFNWKGKICKEYVRLSLKEALANLPSSHFAQVHRSYAVNLEHVKQIKKEGQAYQLLIEGSDNSLPASRHRAHTFLPMLKEILN
ncbi:MAG: LytTR family transcriptional regulator [Desulfobacterales bacterium]|nr:LytTR family transcriptional regulator [Deltaproteobacteria bacterium]NNL42395.1 LytTR family transcriptional regulator [Desulfobacterales bacterium]